MLVIGYQLDNKIKYLQFSNKIIICEVKKRKGGYIFTGYAGVRLISEGEKRNGRA